MAPITLVQLLESVRGSHPLVASIVITVTWIPIEALLIASLQTTPGKWLFGCYLQFSISNAYARRDPRAQLMRALRRFVQGRAVQGAVQPATVTHSWQSTRSPAA